MNIGNEIKRYRKKANLTQKEFANKIHKSERMVQKYESNDITPSIEVLNKIVEVLNVSVNEILNSSDEIIKYFSDLVPQGTIEFKNGICNYIIFAYKSNFDHVPSKFKLTKNDLDYLYKKTIEYIDLLTEKVKKEKELSEINAKIDDKLKNKPLE